MATCRSCGGGTQLFGRIGNPFDYPSGSISCQQRLLAGGIPGQGILNGRVASPSNSFSKKLNQLPGYDRAIGTGHNPKRRRLRGVKQIFPRQ